MAAPFEPAPMMVRDNFFSPTSKSGRLRKACYDKLLQHDRDGAIPTNARFVVYELEQDGVIPKSYPGMKRTPAQDISKALMDLRKAGLIPWEWIVDAHGGRMGLCAAIRERSTFPRALIRRRCGSAWPGRRPSTPHTQHHST
jgi:hypothetical protein